MRSRLAYVGVAIWLLPMMGACSCDERAPSEEDAGPDSNTITGGERGRIPGINRAPTFESEPLLVAREGIDYRYPPVVDDLDGDLVTFELVSGPEGMRVSEETGSVHWLPSHRSVGSHMVHLRVIDEAEAATEQTWTIEVSEANASPRITSRASDMAIAGTRWEYAATAIDADEDTLTWSIETSEDLTVDEEGLVRWDAPAGAAMVTLTVDDGHGGTDSQQFRVVTMGMGDGVAPRVVIDTPEEAQEVSGFVEVHGTVDDDDLVEYVVRACSLVTTSNCYDVEQSSIPVSDGVLARMDTSGMEPGNWRLSVAARDSTGQMTLEQRTCFVKGGAQFGAIRIELVDLAIARDGYEIEIVRAYDGTVQAGDDFGLGWTLTTNLETEEGNEPRAILPAEPFEAGWDVDTNPTGGGIASPAREVLFDLPDGTEVQTFFGLAYLGPTTGGAIVTEEWTVPDGVTVRSLSPSGDSYGELFWREGADLVAFPELDPYQPTKFEVSTPEGDTYLYNGTVLESVTDESGTRPWNSSGSPLDELVIITRDDDGRVTRIEDRQYGDAAIYTYDERRDLVSVRFEGPVPDDSVQTFSYDEQHRMLGYDAPGGRVDRVEYDEQGRIVRVTDGSGAVTTYTYEPGAKIMTDPLGNSTRIEHDEEGHVTAIVDPMGATTTFEYDDDGNEVARIDANGHMTRHEYGEDGRLRAEVDPEGVAKRIDFDESGRVNAFSMGDEQMVGIDYGGMRGEHVVLRDSDGDPLRELTYDQNGNLLAERDGIGRETSATYDAEGREVESIEPDGSMFRTSYDERGLVATTREMNTGLEFTTMHDNNGNVRQLSMPGGRSLEYEYGNGELPRRITDEAGHVYDLRTDGAGRLARVSLDGELVSQTRFDGNGRPISTVDASGQVERIDYDPAGRAIAIHGALGTERLAYDAAGNVVGRTTAEGVEHEYAYDTANRMIEVRDGQGMMFAIDYDEAGRPQGLTDAMGRRNVVETDAFGNRTGMASAGMMMTRYEYDRRSFVPGEDNPSGLMTAMVTGMGQRWEYEYDENDRLRYVHDPAGDTTYYEYALFGDVSMIREADGREWHYEHDASGALQAVVRPSGRTTRYERPSESELVITLPDGSRVSQEQIDDELITTLPDGEALSVIAGPRSKHARTRDTHITTTYGPSGLVTSLSDNAGAIITYRYDDDDQPIQIEANAPGGGTFTFNYVWIDGHLAELIDPDGGTTRYEYDAIGRPVLIEYPNGTSTVVEWGELSRPAAFLHRDAEGSVVSSERFQYDGDAHVTRVEDSRGRRAFQYDHAGRLVAEVDDVGRTSRWTYDAVGNRVAASTEGGVADVSVDADGAITRYGASDFAVDDNGNRIAGHGLQMRYDALGHLLSANGNGSSTDYLYDAEGNLVGRGDTRCLMAPSPLSGRTYCMLEYGADGVSRAYGVDAFGIASRHGGGGARYAQRSLNDSIVALTNSEGSRTAEYAYSPWGEVQTQTGERFRFGYNGEEVDPATGFIYLRTRWYDPRTGQFLTPDSAASDGADPATVHRYVYVRNSPLDYIDPSGEFGLISMMVSMATSQNLRRLNQAAVSCARAYAKSAIVGAVMDAMTNLLMATLFGGLEQAFLGFIDEVIKGKPIDKFLQDFVCSNTLTSPLGESVRFEVVISNCGKAQTFRKTRNGRRPQEKHDCQNRPPRNVPTPRFGTAMDIVINNTFALELKAGASYELDQVLKYCRWASRTPANGGGGSHLVFQVNGNWPPFPKTDGHLDSRTDPHARQSKIWKKAQRTLAALACTMCWLSSNGARGCERGGAGSFGSALVFVGFDRKKRRLRVEVPRLKGLCSGR